eukprot:6190552-Pleurochrysis_carterae.AAC.2
MEASLMLYTKHRTDQANFERLLKSCCRPTTHALGGRYETPRCSCGQTFTNESSLSHQQYCTLLQQMKGI